MPALIAGPKPMIDAATPRACGAVERVSYIPSLAYRLAMVADGALDATFVKPNAHDWDLAAADLILARSRRRSCSTADGRPLAMPAADPRHGALAAGSGALLRRWSRRSPRSAADMLEEVSPTPQFCSNVSIQRMGSGTDMAGEAREANSFCIWFSAAS